MYCKECGAEIMDKAFVCPKCGCLTGSKEANQVNENDEDVSMLKKIAKIFMIIGCVVMGFWLITLVWTIPMTITYCKKVKNNEPISVGFKVCILLFVNTIAGILLLCDNEK